MVSSLNEVLGNRGCFISSILERTSQLQSQGLGLSRGPTGPSPGIYSSSLLASLSLGELLFEARIIMETSMLDYED